MNYELVFNVYGGQARRCKDKTHWQPQPFLSAGVLTQVDNEGGSFHAN